MRGAPPTNLNRCKNTYWRISYIRCQVQLKLNKMKDEERILNKFKDKKTRPLTLGDLEIMFIRYRIMIEEEPDRYNTIEFIEQEDYRRNLFSRD